MGTIYKIFLSKYIMTGAVHYCINMLNLGLEGPSPFTNKAFLSHGGIFE